MDPALIDRGNLRKTVIGPIIRGMILSIPPNTENSMQYGYDENDNNMSNETKRETNHSINNNNTRYMQLTKYNKYTNDDIYTNACVVHMIH